MKRVNNKFSKKGKFSYKLYMRYYRNHHHQVILRDNRRSATRKLLTNPNYGDIKFVCALLNQHGIKTSFVADGNKKVGQSRPTRE